MIFAENRYPLFRIVLQALRKGRLGNGPRSTSPLLKEFLPRQICVASLLHFSQLFGG
jgi:hypothetical protein